MKMLKDWLHYITFPVFWTWMKIWDWFIADQHTKPRMYLEISGSRTGKTHRLVKNIEEYLSKYEGECHVFGVNAEYLTRELSHLSMDRIKVFHSMDQWSRYMRGNNTKYRVYVDDFDYIQSGFPIDINGYYVTTPRFMRNTTDIITGNTQGDPMLKLLHKVDWEYHAYTMWMSNDNGGHQRFKHIVKLDNNVPENMFGQWLK